MRRMGAAFRTIRAAAGQTVARDLDHACDSLDDIARLMVEAARQRADLLVLPECAYPAYYVRGRDEYLRADLLRTAALLDRLSRMAADARLHLVCGVVEEVGDVLFNSAAVFDPTGRLIGMARKNFLWDCDNRWFAAGDAISVFDTALGRVGVLICADARAPEITATLAAQGAGLIVQPTAWVDVGRPGAGSRIEPRTARDLYNIQPDFLIEARAREFGVPFVCADKAGPEPPLHYVGQSLLIDAEGRVRQRGPIEGEALIVDDISPKVARPARVTAAQAARLCDAPTATIQAIAGASFREPVVAELSVSRSRVEFGRSRHAALDGDDMRSFASARCLALDGAQVIHATHAPEDVATLRARAAENRIFVLASTRRRNLVITPDGWIAAESSSPEDEARATVDLSEADIKRFTPETDLWAQRRPWCYKL